MYSAVIIFGLKCRAVELTR